jgi:hypothetical protein
VQLAHQCERLSAGIEPAPRFGGRFCPPLFLAGEDCGEHARALQPIRSGLQQRSDSTRREAPPRETFATGAAYAPCDELRDCFIGGQGCAFAQVCAIERKQQQLVPRIELEPCTERRRVSHHCTGAVQFHATHAR